MNTTCAKWTSGIAMLSATVLLGNGCVVHEHGHGHVHGRAVIIETGHVHSADCGHYCSGEQWYYTRHHRHGPGCGHLFRGGVWITVP